MRDRGWSYPAWRWGPASQKAPSWLLHRQQEIFRPRKGEDTHPFFSSEATNLGPKVV